MAPATGLLHGLGSLDAGLGCVYAGIVAASTGLAITALIR